MPILQKIKKKIGYFASSVFKSSAKYPDIRIRHFHTVHPDILLWKNNSYIKTNCVLTKGYKFSGSVPILILPLFAHVNKPLLTCFVALFPLPVYSTSP